MSAEFCETGVIPKENFTQQQERRSTDNESLSFDHCQWDGNGLGHGPDGMTTLSDHHERRDVEHSSHGGRELAAAIRDEVSRLSPEDQSFFYQYIDSKYQSGERSDADRQRFHRLRLRIKQAVTV